MSENHDAKKYAVGILSTTTAFMMWGVLPLYWKQLMNISPIEILANRILWSFFCMLILLLVQKGWKEIRDAAANRSVLKYSLISGIIITMNWGTYIWAVNANHVVEASLGYYITPLFMVLLGTVLYKERLSKLQIVALCMAFIGVLVLSIQFGKVPWIAFVLTITFSLYGLIKKQIQAGPLVALILETAMMSPLAILYIFTTRFTGAEGLNAIDLRTGLLLVGAGIVTSIPLLLFAKGTKSIAFSTVGFIQYLAPSISLMLGIFVFREPFTGVHVVSFSFIWCALILYSFSLYSAYQRSKPVTEELII